MDQKNTDEPLLEAKNPVAKPKRRFLENTSIYGLELAIAMVTILIVSTVLAIGAYALSQYIYGSAGSGNGQLALWSAASTIVWLPVVYIFYVRSRAYMERNPDVVGNDVQRAFVIIYQVITVLTVIAFSFTAVYSMLSAFVQANDMSRTLVTISLPSLISALVFAGAFVAFFRKPVFSRKAYANGLLIASLLIVVPVIAYSMLTLRGANLDSNRSTDLYRLESAISYYYNQNSYTLPDSLGDLPSNTRDGLNMSLSDYEYQKKSSTKYELCATFSTNTKDTDKSNSSYYDIERSTSNDYTSHPAGKQCYDVTKSYYSTYPYGYGLDDTKGESSSY